MAPFLFPEPWNMLMRNENNAPNGAAQLFFHAWISPFAFNMWNIYTTNFCPNPALRASFSVYLSTSLSLLQRNAMQELHKKHFAE